MTKSHRGIRLVIDSKAESPHFVVVAVSMKNAIEFIVYVMTELQVFIDVFTQINGRLPHADDLAEAFDTIVGEPGDAPPQAPTATA